MTIFFETTSSLNVVQLVDVASAAAYTESRELSQAHQFPHLGDSFKARMEFCPYDAILVSSCFGDWRSKYCHEVLAC